MTKNKTLTLDEILVNVKMQSTLVRAQNSITGHDVFADPEPALSKAKQAILQWVADEVVGEDRPHEEEYSSKVTKMQQRQILKAAGWKPSDKEEK